jgi:choice-of-anchor B domain-containing protein
LIGGLFWFREESTLTALNGDEKLLLSGLSASSGLPQGQGSISLLGHLSFPVEKIRDVWAYVDSTTGREYALVGYRHERDRGIFIVDVTNPTNLRLASQATSTPSFDIKTFKHYAYAVYGTATPEARVIDIRNPEDPTVVGSFPSGHNLSISSTGYMFLENPGLRIFDLNSDPTKPTKVWDDGDPTQDGHDSAVINNRLYDFHGHSGTKIFDVSTPESPLLIGLIQDPAVAFHHSGWVTANEEYLFICDELAKPRGRPADITVWDISDVTNPVKVAGFADSSATVHNLYIIGDHAYISYYTSGFSILDVSDPGNPILVDTYDTAPNLDGPELKGAFGVYPFSSSGNIYVSDTETGLYVFAFSSLTPGDSTGHPSDLPVVHSFHPSSGPVGITVTVHGENFVDVTEVRFGAGPTSPFTVSSRSQLLVTVPVGASSGEIRVTTAPGTAESFTSFTVLFEEIESTLQFGASDDAYVSSKRPTSDNSEAQELRVRRTQKAAQFAFFKFPVSGVSGRIVSAKLRLYTVEASDDGGSAYLVGNNFRDGTASWTEEDLKWENAPLMPTGALSSTGPVAANEYVEFDVTAGIGGEGVWSFAIKNNSSDVVKYASRESSHPPVLLLDVKSPQSLPKIPVITTFAPATGTPGTEVTITGRNLGDTSEVRFGGTEAENFTAHSDSLARAVVPAGATSGKIRITTAAGIAESATDFVVERLPLLLPVIDSFTPAAGVIGAPVTVSGRNFIEVVAVRFNNVAAPDFAVEADGQLRVVVPDAATSGKITIENRNGIGSSEEDFTVLVESGGSSYLFTPTDDAFVWSKNISNNYAGWEELRVRQSVSATQVTYLRFQVTGVVGPVAEAKLRLFSIDESDQGGSVHLVSNSYSNTSTPWQETGLDWTTAPSADTPEISSTGIVEADAIVEFDVTSAVSGDGVFSFAIRNSSNDAVKYSSKEGVVTPELLIVTESRLSETTARDQALLAGPTTRSSDLPPLDYNYPNPFNIETRISYHLSEPAIVLLLIYNVKGQLVRRLVDEYQAAGRRTASWNGRDDAGAVVGTGVYIYLLQAGPQRRSGKMILQK